MDEQFMNLAMGEAEKSKELLKCGVVIVKDNKTVVRTYNSQRSDNDASAHAEIKAIRIAGKKLGNKNLNGTTIYCTCEPCTMCLSAIILAKISRVVYKTKLSEMSDLRIKISSKDLLKKSKHNLIFEQI